MQTCHILSVLMCVGVCGAKLLLVETKGTDNTETENNETGLKISDRDLVKDPAPAKRPLNLTSNPLDQDDITGGEDYMSWQGFRSGFANSYLVTSNSGVKTHYCNYLGKYVQTGYVTWFPERWSCNPRLPIYKHESNNLYLYVQCNHWVIAPKLHPSEANVFAKKTEVNDVPTVKGWMFWHNGWKYPDHSMKVIDGPGLFDVHDSCKFWSEGGECKYNPNYMLYHCKESCNRCIKCNAKIC